MMEEPSCGVSVAAVMQSPMCGGGKIAFASLYVSFLAASMAPPDLRLVMGLRVGYVWINL